MADENDLEYYDETGIMGNVNSKEKQKRNVWTEKKNAALVECVKRSTYPCPWRPKHGTSKEVWTDIVNKMAERTDVFDKPIHWEAAKDHLLTIIERQKMRRSLGDFEVKTDTERYVDEMIKHMLAEDAEKAASLLRQKDRQSQGGNSGMMPGSNRQSMDNPMSMPDMVRKRKLEHLAPDSLLQLSNGSENGDGVLADDNSIGHNYIEREKIRLEYELQKEKARNDRDKERDELLIQRDQEFIKFVQDQLAASQAMFQTTNELISKLIAKLEAKSV